jgi:predicted patatin/cPLA2 family phospholipase
MLSTRWTPGPPAGPALTSVTDLRANNPRDPAGDATVGNPSNTPHEVVRVLLERVRAGVTARTDHHRVALAIEGGGMRGTVTGGMALALHELGLVGAFDAVYGSSAGGISGAWLVSVRPAGLRGWCDPAYASTLIRWRNAMLGRAVVDVEALIERVYQTVHPLDFGSVLDSPVPLHLLATDVMTGASTDLRPLVHTTADLRLALRASAAMPVLAGPPVELGGRRFYDAGLSESIPYRTAVAQGATHVLVLRSRREGDSARPSRSARLVAGTALRRHTPALRAMFVGRHGRLAEDDRQLADAGQAAGGPAILAIRPAADSPRVSRLARRGDVLHAALEAGRVAVQATFGAALPHEPESTWAHPLQPPTT